VFFTLQFPFVDLRPFVLDTPETLFRQLSVGEPFESLNGTRQGYVRSFGTFRHRRLRPNFNPKKQPEKPNNIPAAEYPKGLQNLWSEEDCFADAHHGLLLPNVETHKLAGGKLGYPRVKVRSLRFSPYPPGDRLWSPGIRIETGINYFSKEPMSPSELIQALEDFLNLPSLVPQYRKTEDGDKPPFKRCVCKAPLINQPDALARLIVDATTAQSDTSVHYKMVVPEAPLLAVHFFPDELADVPDNVEWLPLKLTRGEKMGYFPFRVSGTQVGVWMLELPSSRESRAGVKERREVMRNYTIATMRYWTELRSAIAVRKSVRNGEFGFCLGGNSLLKDYFGRGIKFLFKKTWHGTNLSMIRSIVNAYEELPEEAQIHDPLEALQEFPRQIAENAKRFFDGLGRVGVFVSYSHHDSAWRREIQAALAGLHDREQIAYFDDTGLEAGDNWSRKIKRSIDTATVAVLLVSDSFLQSEFIREHELPRIEELSRRRKLGVIPVWITGHIPDSSWIGALQLLSAAEGPLAKASPSSVQQAMKALEVRVKKMAEEHGRTVFKSQGRTVAQLS